VMAIMTEEGFNTRSGADLNLKSHGYHD